MKDGSLAPFEGVDIFEIDATDKIRKLTIIYDTHQTRIKFEELKS